MAHAQCQPGRELGPSGPCQTPLFFMDFLSLLQLVLLWLVSPFSQSGPAMSSSPSKRQFACWEPQVMTRAGSKTIPWFLVTVTAWLLLLSGAVVPISYV